MGSLAMELLDVCPLHTLSAREGGEDGVWRADRAVVIGSQVDPRPRRAVRDGCLPRGIGNVH